MKKGLALLLCAMILALTAVCALAEIKTLEVEKCPFVNQYRYARHRAVNIYPEVYSVNHMQHMLTPFDASVPVEYFTEDSEGYVAVAPIVLDITDAMRNALYGDDLGFTAMFYGQYCEMKTAKDYTVGYTGVHEGIDFICDQNVPLHAILGGTVTKAGDRNGTVGIYNEEYDVTVLYLHCQRIRVRRGMKIEAGDIIAREGKRGSGAYYTHVEVRNGRHTSSNSYRDHMLQSDCPYPVMKAALGVDDSGRAPVTYATVAKAERQRAEAEAEALAQRIAQQQAEAQAADEVIDLVDVLPGNEGYGFTADQAEAGDEILMPEDDMDTLPADAEVETEPEEVEAPVAENDVPDDMLEEPVVEATLPPSAA